MTGASGDNRHLRFWTLPAGQELPLDNGLNLAPVTVAYETYGQLNAGGDNAVLVCHALTGDAHAARHDAGDEPGWWEGMIGPGLPLDTDRFFVICSNVLGGCRGSTGPGSVRPAAAGGGEGRVWGTDFPVITVFDMVRLQGLLLDHLGVTRLAAAVGASLGGMQSLAWGLIESGRVERSIVIGAPARSSSQAIAYNEVARQAILTDPEWQGGHYAPGAGPARGLAVARMLGMITYRSWVDFDERFGRNRITGGADPVAERLPGYATSAPAGHPFGMGFQVAGYLHYQGEKLVRRFDANTFLYLTRAMDLFSIDTVAAAAWHQTAAQGVRFTGIGISSDILYLPGEVRSLINELRSRDITAEYREIESEAGHDAFLIDLEQTGAVIRDVLEARVCVRRGA
ncbi:MAG: homoserine O-acetyltransferase [Thermaerobacterales bacterium]